MIRDMNIDEIDTSGWKKGGRHKYRLLICTQVSKG